MSIDSVISNASHSGGIERLPDDARQLRVQQVAYREIHRRPDGEVRLAPGRALRERHRENMREERLDEARPLREGNELAGCDEAALRVAPPRERLDPDRLAFVEPPERVRANTQLIALK